MREASITITTDARREEGPLTGRVAARRISVVVPVYREQHSIATCLDRLHAALCERDHEILVCYDFDEDPTLAAIAAMPLLPASVRLVKNAHGRGVANALRAGFAAATGDVVVTTMADLADPPQVIPQLADAARRGAAVVSGSRYMKGGSQQGGPWLKGMLSRAAGLSLRWVAGVPTHDATNNFRAYRCDFLRRVDIDSEHAFDIALELTVKAHAAGLLVGEVPSSWTDRSAGQSRFQLAKWLPRYLRWWWLAMRVPLSIWGAWFALAAAALLRTATEPATLRVSVAACALIGFALVLAARALRGRMRGVDMLLAVAWTHPWHAHLWRAGWGLADVAVTGAASLALLAWIHARARAERDPAPPAALRSGAG